MDHFLLINERGAHYGLTFEPMVPTISNGLVPLLLALCGFLNERFCFSHRNLISILLLKKDIHGIALDQL